VGRQLAPLVLAALACLAIAPSAEAADSIYWTTGSGPNPVSFARLDGSGGGILTTPGVTGLGPEGVAIDAAAGRLYWANDGGANPISFARLDGSGGANLTTVGATPGNPIGATLDPTAGRIYWANNGGPNPVSFARLDGSGGGNLPSSGATVNGPEGVAIDPAAGRIYWANDNPGPNPISFARLDGSGGGFLPITGATASHPEGVAIDSAAGRIYWANNGGANPISYARLDGSGGANLPTAGATPNNPQGVALDPAAGRIYWANTTGPNPISYAALDGSGGGNLHVSGTAPGQPTFPALLESPKPTQPPLISGRPAPGSKLTCSAGDWASDLFASQLYRAPQSFAFGWTRNATAVAAATTDAITAGKVGTYRCQVAASNQAGSGSQASAALAVFKVGKVKRMKLAVKVPAAGKVRVLDAPRKSRAIGAVARRSLKPSSASGGPGTVKVKLRLRGSARKGLAKSGHLRVKASVSFTPTGGAASIQTATLRLRKRAG